MSMLTNNTRETTKKKGRWQAILLAGLVLAGSVAVPQAANAVTTTQGCYFGPTSCSVKVKTSQHRILLTTTSYGINTEARYTVRTNGGKLLCKGTIKHGGSTKGCYFPNYDGAVKVTISKPALFGATLTVRY
ncbi:hypothetical protein ACTJKK_09680 [Microbacterium sp. 22179]|jgi:hypothetical protein|uniref:hypothetical protein n=1 Tax=Microbacterium sp. 22179 TaxID=3453886 RepID=UPI003F876340